jgi:methionyl-tRNA formyltransferase
MRVAFFGFQTWGLVSLQAIHESGHDVVLVVTHEPTHAPYASSFTESVDEYARDQSLPLIVAGNSEERAVTYALRSAAVDVIVSSNWRRKMGASTLALSVNGGINVHRSLLPMYGGFAPVNWAIAMGETETGVTIHGMDAEMDLGAIYAQEKISIGPNETATSVFHRMTPVIQRLLPEVLASMAAGTLKGTHQDPSEQTFFHQRGEREFTIDWSASALDVYNLIRAQSDPFPSARTVYRGAPLHVHAARLGPSSFRGSPSRLVAREPDGVVVLCGRHGRPQALVITVVSVGGDFLPQKANAFFSKLGDYLGS